MAAPDAKSDPRTVFVRGVGADVDDQKLTERFSEVGPVKRAFLVRRGKDAAHRGFGFVQFALQEDAERAVTQLQGLELGGRKLKVEVAVKRAPLEERKKRKQAPEGAAPEGAAKHAKEAAPQQQQPAAKKARPARPAAADAKSAAEAKQRLVRAVAVGGLTQATLSAAVALAKAVGEVEEVVSPLPAELMAAFKLARDGCSGEAFMAIYKTTKQAMAAVERLHGQQLLPAGGRKGKKAAAAQQGSDEGGGGGEAAVVWARQVSGEGMHLKRWRLILRNLPFTATEADVRAAFAPAGFVWQLTLPRSASGRGRGFAFVNFVCKAQAEHAIPLVNGKLVAGRPVAVDWALAKSQFAAATVAAGAAGEAEGRDAGLDALMSDLEDDDARPRPPPGGRALGQENDDEGAAAMLPPEQERQLLSSVVDGLLRESDDDGESDEGLGSEEEEEAGSEEEEDGDDLAASDPFSRKQLQKGEQAQQAALTRLARQQPKVQQPKAAAALTEEEEAAKRAKQLGATVFVRGLPLDVSKEQLFRKMKSFGPVRACRLVMDKDSANPKGTAFVEYYEPAGAGAAAAACAKGRAKEGPGVAVAGRVVEVDVAVAQEDARQLAVSKTGGAARAGGSSGGASDKRHLGLAKEGQLEEGSPAWEDMSTSDRAKRKRAADEKKLKLKSPNFVVSSTRLSVRNIPPSWTEKQLKTLFVQAVKERASKALPVIQQSKILLDESRPGPDGAPRSKGIGFVEFADHEHALCALRQLNNNPKPFGKERRPIVEFALENVKALKLRESKQARAKQKAQQQPAQSGKGGGEGEQPQKQTQQQERSKGGKGEGSGGKAEAAADEPGEGPAPLSKRQKRRELQQMIRERKQQQQEQQREKQQEGNGSAPALAEPGAKSQRRREQRKKHKLGGAAAEGGAPAALPTPTPAWQPAANGGARRQPVANSRTAKVAAQQQQEQGVQRRKRQADQQLDQLAGGSDAPPQKRGRQQGKQQPQREGADKLDRMVQEYKRKYFEGPASQPGKPALKASLKRWFE